MITYQNYVIDEIKRQFQALAELQHKDLLNHATIAPEVVTSCEETDPEFSHTLQHSSGLGSLDALKITQTILEEFRKLTTTSMACAPSLKSPPFFARTRIDKRLREAVSVLFSTKVPNLPQGLQQCLQLLSDPFAATLAAFCLMQGVGCMPNPGYAIEILTSLPADPRAQALLAECYIFGKGTEKDVERGLELLESAYPTGDLYASLISGDCARLGAIYAGMPDCEQAMKEYQRILESDDPRYDTPLMKCLARLRLANMSEGQTALDYLREAIKFAYPVAWYDYGRLLLADAETDADRKSGMMAIERAAEAKYLPACVYMAQTLSTSAKFPEDNLGKAVNYYLYAAEQGDLGFQDFTIRYRQELKADSLPDYDFKQIFESFSKRVEASHDANSQVNLGLCYYFGYGVVQDSQQAYEWYLKAANQGHDWAEYWVGRCYYHAEGIEQDYQLALEWFVKSANHENTHAQYKLGYYYELGKCGVGQDYHQAFDWYVKAAHGGSSPACCVLGKWYYSGTHVAQNYSQALKWYLRAAHQNDAAAQYSVGCCYDCGEGTDQNHEKAVEWYRKSAYGNHVKAQYHLARCYRKGHGVTADPCKAFKWYMKAAKQGEARSQYQIGAYYASGAVPDIAQDHSQAYQWYTKAAAQGVAEAENGLGDCYYFGRGVARDYRQAFEWYCKAAAQGIAVGESNVGDCYYFGHGVDQDYRQARDWYKKAADKGYSYAQGYLSKCDERLSAETTE